MSTRLAALVASLTHTWTRVFCAATGSSRRTSPSTEQMDSTFDGVSMRPSKTRASATPYGASPCDIDIDVSPSCSWRVPTAMHEDVAATSPSPSVSGMTPALRSITRTSEFLGATSMDRYIIILAADLGQRLLFSSRAFAFLEPFEGRLSATRRAAANASLAHEINSFEVATIEEELAARATRRCRA